MAVKPPASPRDGNAPAANPTRGIPISNAVKSRLTRSRASRCSPLMPSAAATAKVSSPSGTMRPISFRITNLFKLAR